MSNSMTNRPVKRLYVNWDKEEGFETKKYYSIVLSDHTSEDEEQWYDQDKNILFSTKEEAIEFLKTRADICLDKADPETIDNFKVEEGTQWVFVESVNYGEALCEIKDTMKHPFQYWNSIDEEYPCDSLVGVEIAVIGMRCYHIVTRVVHIKK